jgi:hypothetical protein
MRYGRLLHGSLNSVGHFSAGKLKPRIAGLTVIYVEGISKKDRKGCKKDRDPKVFADLWQGSRLRTTDVFCG